MRNHYAVATMTGLLALASGFGHALAQTGTLSARIVVRLPADATLFVENIRLPQSGATRTLDTPPLEAGHVYYYDLRAEVLRDGKTLRVTKKVSFMAGETAKVDFGSLPSEAPAVSAKPVRTPGEGAFKLSTEEQEILDLTNKEREKTGLAPLRANAKLVKAARDHSANMARLEMLDHELEGKGPGERLAAVEYASSGWGENCAAGQRTPAAAVESWMNSEGHRGNILNGSYEEIGVAVANSTGGGRYWTQVFARPAGR
jgi:uncharacterized protein (TIGR03000 family)